jgi:hypothetical protein
MFREFRIAQLNIARMLIILVSVFSSCAAQEFDAKSA